MDQEQKEVVAESAINTARSIIQSLSRATHLDTPPPPGLPAPGGGGAIDDGGPHPLGPTVFPHERRRMLVALRTLTAVCEGRAGWTAAATTTTRGGSCGGVAPAAAAPSPATPPPRRRVGLVPAPPRRRRG